VIFATLVLQGLTLPALIRRLGVARDGSEDADEIRARLMATEAALAQLDELEHEDWTREDTIERMRRAYEYRKRRFAARMGKLEDDGYEDWSLAYQQIIQIVLGAQREALVRMRSDGEISNETMNQVIRELDLAESRLEISISERASHRRIESRVDSAGQSGSNGTGWSWSASRTRKRPGGAAGAMVVRTAIREWSGRREAPGPRACRLADWSAVQDDCFAHSTRVDRAIAIATTESSDVRVVATGQRLKLQILLLSRSGLPLSLESRTFACNGEDASAERWGTSCFLLSLSMRCERNAATRIE
jgi:hypothetical protein